MRHVLPVVVILLIASLLSPVAASASDRDDLLLAIQTKNIGKVQAMITASPALVKTLLMGKSEDGRLIKAIPLYWAARDGSPEMIEYLLAQGSDINTTNSLGYSPLHAAVGKARKDVVTLLLSRGANAATKETEMGFTPLHTAAGRGYLEIVRILLNAGADINAKGLQNGPCTPLDHTIVRLYFSNEPYSPARFETIKFLRSRGAMSCGPFGRLPDVKGEVLDTSEIQKQQCTISIGSRDGLAPGDTVSIQRGGVEIGAARITAAEPGSSTVMLLAAPSASPGRGDGVVLQKKGPSTLDDPTAQIRQEIETLAAALGRHREQVAQYLEKTTLP